MPSRYLEVHFSHSRCHKLILPANQIFPSFEALCDYYISSEWQPANLYTPKPTSDVVSEIGSFFPFKNRVKSRKILLEAIQEQYNMWKNKASYSEDTFRKSLSHILVGGAPGMAYFLGFFFVAYIF